jgi:CHAT domain-containing protein
MLGCARFHSVLSHGFRRSRHQLMLATTFVLVGTCLQAQYVRAQDIGGAEFDIDAPTSIGTELDVRARATPPASGTAADLCAFYQKRGIAQYAMGRYTAAIADLTQAYAASVGQQGTEECSSWRIRSDLAAAYRASGDILGEIDYLQRAIAEVGPKMAGQYLLLHAKLAGSYLQLGRIDDAKQALADAKTTLPELKRRKSWPSRENDLMSTLHGVEVRIAMAEGKYPDAERLARQSLDEQRAFLHDQKMSFTPGSAQVRSATEHMAQKERDLASALASLGKLGEAALFARVALTDTLALSGPNTLETGNALSLLGQIRLRQENVEQAGLLFDRGLESLQKAQIEPYSRALARMRAWKGLTLSLQGRWSQAIEIFERRDKDLRLNDKQFSMIGSGNLDWALCLIRIGRPAAAERMLNNMLSAREKRGYTSRVLFAYLHGYLGIALAEQGRDTAAFEQFALALPELTKTTVDVENTDSDGGFVRQFRLRAIFEAYLDALSRAHTAGLAVNGNDPANEAFAIADIARNSSVQRAVTSSAARASLPDARLAQLARDEQDSERRVQSLDRLLERLSTTAPGPDKNAATAALEHDISEANARRTAIRDELTHSFPAYRNLTDPAPVTPVDVQRVLRPGEAVLSVYVGERYTYVWTITSEAVLFRRVGLTRAEVIQQVAAVRRSVDLTSGRLRRFDTADAERLYAMLVAPDASAWSSARVLSFVPSGALGQLPLGLLLTAPVSTTPSGSRPNYADMPWLLKKVAVGQYPSANALVALRTSSSLTAQRLPFVGFGNPVFAAETRDGGGALRALKVVASTSPAGADDGEPVEILAVRHLATRAPSSSDSESSAAPANPGGEAVVLSSIYSRLPPLPDTADELNEIARITGARLEQDVFLGMRATVGNVRGADLLQYRVVAFATHGVAPGDVIGLDEPALALSNPVLVKETGSGLLGLEDILGLKLNADWVVLSACNTASGDSIGSEAVSGLGRAFMYAGSRSLLVSNWAVETVSARLLTTGVFRQQHDHPSISRAEALRAAELEVMQQPGGRYRHPAFWAAFSLIGDGVD